MKPSQSNDPQIPVGPFRVLIADDEHLVVTGLAAAMRNIGHTVVGMAPDGEAAISLARQHTPDIALLDIRMPKMNGIDAAMVLFQELAIPSVIISAYSDDEYLDRIRAHGLSAGVYGYLIKPVEAEDLRVTVRIAMQRAVADLHRAGRITQLEQNLANRRVVEQAKWLLVQKLGITEPQAHDKLQRAARDRRKQLLEIAQHVVESGGLPQ
jgi:two-component system, response regulator PdtaR